MKKGFTIIELLVASLLLGLLVTILTMIFNQSSIAWRTGMAGISDMDDVRKSIAQIREEADNAFVCNNETHLLLSPWKADGSLRTRACDIAYSAEGAKKIPDINDTQELTSLGLISAGSTDKSRRGSANYVVNVMSAGPDREWKTNDDIWSWPDDFD